MTATPTQIVRLDHFDVPADPDIDARFPPGSDERFAWTLHWACEFALSRQAAKRRAEEDARRAAAHTERDRANAEARAQWSAGLSDYEFGDDFR